MPESWVERLRKLQEARKVPPPLPPIEPRSDALLVQFQAPWSRLEVGWDIAIRAWSKAMHLVGVDVRLPLASIRSDEVMADAGHLGKRSPPPDVHITSGSFATARILDRSLESLSRKRRPVVFHTMFERTDFDPAIAHSLNMLDGVWVPCSANADELRRIGVDNVRHFPVPHFESDRHLRLPPPKENRAFYWIGSWSPHKSPDNLIRAFMRAFRPGEARLLIKRQYVHKSMPTPEKVAEEGFGQNGWDLSNWQAHITIESRTFSAADMVEKIHGAGDVYVSASRGEGFDMPAYAAKLAGRRVITTDSGGPRDFLGERDVLIRKTGVVRVHRDYAVHGWEPTSTYADYLLDDLVKAMLRVRAEPVAIAEWPIEKFTARHVGGEIKEWLEALHVHQGD